MTAAVKDEGLTKERIEQLREDQDASHMEFAALCDMALRSLLASEVREGAIEDLGKWYSPDEVKIPGQYLREGSEDISVVEFGPVRHLPAGGGKPFYADALIIDGSTARQDWGDSRFFGPISIQKLIAAALSPVPAALPDGWISVKERLPDDSGYFLVALKSKYVTDMGYNKLDGWHKGDLAEYWQDKVTHWLPLPAAPEQP